MRITVKVKPRSKKESVKKIADNFFEVCFNVAPEKGKANKKLILMLSDYFKIPQSNFKIVSGRSSNKKIIEILE